jgi:hypothetical protein
VRKFLPPEVPGEGFAEEEKKEESKKRKNRYSG